MADEEKTTAKKTTTKKETKPKTSTKKQTTKKVQQSKKPVKKEQKKTTTETKKETKPEKEDKKTTTAKKTTSPKKEEKTVETKKEEKKIKKPKTKIKPQLKSDLKDKLEKRKEIKKRTPEFLREEWFRYKRIPKNWRRPDGITSKMRINLKYRPSRVRVGFRGPKDVRGLHSSGFEEVVVHNVNDLDKINPKTQAARIGGTVGTRKRTDIGKKAEELKIRVLNL